MSISYISDVLFERHPTRYTKKEKTAFLETVTQHFKSLGYTDDEIATVKENGRNLVIGDPEKAKYFITAHYDTPGSNGFLLSSSALIGQSGANALMLILMIPLFILGMYFGVVTAQADWGILPSVLSNSTPMLMYLFLMLIPTFIKNRSNRNDNTSGVLGVMRAAELAAADDKLRKLCCFVLFDNEEWGLLGSAGFAKHCMARKIKLNTKTVINIDCIGEGEIFGAFTTGKPAENVCKVLDKMDETGEKLTRKRSAMVFMSDHANFKCSVMLSRVKKSACGLLYLPRIHTWSDVNCDINLVESTAKRVVDAIGATE